MNMISSEQELVYLVDTDTAATTIGIIDSTQNEQEDSTEVEEIEGISVVKPTFLLDYQPTQASIYVTSRCNLDCDYCYIKNRYNETQHALSLEEWKLVIKQLHESGIRKLSFLGGEPFLYPHLCELIKYSDNLGFVGLEVSTNGSIELLQKNIDVLQTLEKTQARTSISISLDSTDKLHHNKLRGNYDSVIEGIKLLVQRKFTISLAAVLTKENIEQIEQMVELGASLGVQAFQFNGLIPMNSEQMRLVIKDYDSLYSISKQLEQLEQKHNGKIKIINRLLLQSTLTPDLLLKYSDNEILCNCSLVGCPAARREAYILPNGSLVPCPMLIPNEFFHSEQKVPNEPFSKVWIESESLKIFRERLSSSTPGECAECEFERLCRGGCPALSKYLGGDMHKADPRCPIIKR